MKEAAGEANMTVIVIVLIGIVAAVGAIFIPALLRNMDTRSCCVENGGEWVNGACSISGLDCGNRTGRE